MNLWTILIIGYVLTWALVPHVLLSDKRPVATIAWIWSIILFPYLGALCYWGFGSDRIQRKRLARRARFHHGIVSRRHRGATAHELPLETRRDADLLGLLARVNGVSPALADEVDLLYGAPAFFDELLRGIDRAEHHVHIQFYIWRNDRCGREMLDALVRAARRGVEVRLLIDEMGSIGLRSKFFRPLLEAGGNFSWALTIDPLRNRFFWHLRNHRKLQIIDGRIAFLGGMNVGREYFGDDPAIGPWQDAQLKLTGPVVELLQETFADDWYFATEEKITADEYYAGSKSASSGEANAASSACPVQLITGGPDVPDEPVLKSLVALLNHASERVWITTGYFVPSHIILTAAQLCAARGVDVRFLLAGRSDFASMVYVGRSYYEELLRAGVRLWEYHAGFMHAKMMLIDDRWAMVGSINWDIRSMRHNFELSALVQQPSLAQRLEGIFEEEFDRAREIRLEEFKNRPFRHRLREAVLRPISPLL